MSDATFKVGRKNPKDSVEDWQRLLLSHMRAWGWDPPLKVDGIYGQATRAFTGLVLKGHGIAQSAMDNGVTPQLRIKVRNKRLSATELARKARRQPWRIRMRKRWRHSGVAYPVHNVIVDTHGFSAGHDGIDIITPPEEPLFAICDGTVSRVSDDWWGLGNPGGALGDKGDGIIMIECEVDDGPFRPGLQFGYGHAEKPVVKEGDHIRAGQRIGNAGFANAWHPHFMVNGGTQKLPDGRPKGVGDRDPRPFLDFARRNS